MALSGSCSTQSLKQVARYRESHPALVVTAEAVLDGALTATMARDWVLTNLNREPMVFSSADPDTVRAAQARFGRDGAAHSLERLMAELAQLLLAAGVRRFVIGGGETSGAIVSALGIDRLRIGPEIDPGVPVLAAGNDQFGIVLKSGNFGGEDFYERAFRALEMSQL